MQPPHGVQWHDNFEFGIEAKKRLKHILFIPEKAKFIDPQAWIFGRNEDVVNMHYDAGRQEWKDREIFMNYITADPCHV
jgi:hypothetical protein